MSIAAPQKTVNVVYSAKTPTAVLKGRKKARNVVYPRNKPPAAPQAYPKMRKRNVEYARGGKLYDVIENGAH